MSDKVSMLKTFLGGVAAGVTLGVLLAPQSGKETRQQIGQKAKVAEASMHEMIANGKASWFAAKNQIAGKAAIEADEVDNFIHHILNEGKAWWYGTKADAYELADEMGDEAKRVSNNAKAALDKKLG